MHQDCQLKNAGLLTNEVIEGPPLESLCGLAESREVLRLPLIALGECARVRLGATV